MFEALVQEVFQLTNRPDLRAETESAIKQAILNYHHLDFFWRDKTMGVINVTSGVKARHEINLAQFTGLRAIASVSPYYSDDQCGLKLIQNRSLGATASEYWQLLGDKLVISSRTPTNKFALEYWQNPVLSPTANINSWVVDLYRDAVLDAALAKIFETIRDPAAADRYRARVGNKLAPGTHCAVILGEQLEQQIRSY